jgi:HD-GYP domain-containing protein (c-di-GMP phosphodiesterase class II)/ribonuclease BN (tRNA processing enzyme)
MKINVLGAYGNKAKNKFTTCFQINKNILIDAGNIINGVKEPEKIKHIFLTHAHLDHIIDIPFLIDNIYEKMSSPLYIYGSKKTLEYLQKHMFNNKLWPDFQNISLTSNNHHKAVNFITIKENRAVNIGKTEFIPFKVNHTVETFGYIINKKVLISADTSLSDNLIKQILTYKPECLFLEVSFPEKLRKIADISKHMTPNDIKKIISALSYSPKNIFLYHIKPNYENKIKKELDSQKVVFLKGGEIIDCTKNSIRKTRDIRDIAMEMIKDLYIENDLSKVLEKIITYSRNITGADGATLYIKNENDTKLEFKIIQNETLNTYLKDNIPWKNLDLYINGIPNYKMVATMCALKGKIINIKDAYHTEEFDFSGTRDFDQKNSYRSKSMLVIPLKNHEKEIIGVLQLINKKSYSKIIPFTKEDEELIFTLASIAAVSITKNKLIEDFEKLLSSLIKTIGMAIDEKSKYTSGHVQRVAELSLMIADALEKENIKHYTKNELKMIEIAGWLHDIGKIATPEYVMDKSAKLEKIIDRIELIKYKFDLLKKNYYIEYLENKISKKEYETKTAQADENFEFLKKLNKGSESVSKEDLKRLENIAKTPFHGETLLNSDELKNLSVQKGTLTEEEIKIMQNHAALGLKMLTNLHFPKKFKKLPEIAANHHEKLNGKGYPRGLDAKILSTEERILAIADIFEALSAADRPYKEPKKLSEIFKILYFMCKDGEIDKNIIKIFLKSGVYLQYAKKELQPQQIDEIPKEILDYFLDE